MSASLQRERAYYLAHQETLAQLYSGKVVVIKGDVVLAAYDEAIWAKQRLKKRFAGAFFAQKVVARPESA